MNPFQTNLVLGALAFLDDGGRGPASYGAQSDHFSRTVSAGWG